MVFHSTHSQSFHLVLTGNTAEIGPEALLQVRFDEGSAFFRGEHAMHETTDKGVHRWSLSSLAGLISVLNLFMSLNMLIETPGGFDYTGADCMGWMKEIGFRETRVEQLVGPDSMVVGIK